MTLHCDNCDAEQHCIDCFIEDVRYFNGKSDIPKGSEEEAQAEACTIPKLIERAKQRIYEAQLKLAEIEKEFAQ